MSNVRVAIVCGSPNDLPLLEGAKAILEEFGVEYEMKVSSAHRNPDQTGEWAKGLVGRGVCVVLAAAGYANHLAGAVAANTILPVVGIPLDSSPLNGMDALLSTVMMPSGVPVATVTVGKAGAKNAAILAVQILGVSDAELREKLIAFKNKMSAPRG